MPPKKVATKTKKAPAKAATKASKEPAKRKTTTASKSPEASGSSTSKNSEPAAKKQKTPATSTIPDLSVVNFKSNAKSPSGKKWNLKLSSWNVNGIRAWLGKNGQSFLEHEKPDILCIQETKCSDDKLPKEIKEVAGYHCYWLSGDKEGYSGVGLLSKIEPKSIIYGIGQKEHDNEGRVITAEYDKFYLVNVYVPNAGRGLVRLDYRMKWDTDFRKYLKKLDSKKHLILCGDMNVAHEEIDLANPKTNKKTAGFTQEERDGFSTLLGEGFVDTFRHLYPEQEGAYSFWTYLSNARERNVGWRLDYFVVSQRCLPHVCDSLIRSEVHGSDHCPVTLLMVY